MNSLIFRQVARAVFPVSLIFALHLLLRGHDRPGGGFIAGLVITTTVLLEVLVYGSEAALRRYTRYLRPATWVGLAIALGSGLLPVLWGEAVFTFPHWTFRLFGSGEMGLSTTLLFDVGVFLVIVGATTTAIAMFIQPDEAEATT